MRTLYLEIQMYIDDLHNSTDERLVTETQANLLKLHEMSNR